MKTRKTETDQDGGIFKKTAPRNYKFIPGILLKTTKNEMRLESHSSDSDTFASCDEKSAQKKMTK